MVDGVRVERAKEVGEEEERHKNIL